MGGGWIVAKKMSIDIGGPEDIFKFFPKTEIENLEAMLNEPISDELGALGKQIAVMAAQQGRVAKLLADSESLLSFAENKVLMERDPKQTDLDRKIYMKASTKNERRLRDILLGFSKALRGKLIASQSLRKVLFGEVVGGQ